ncbi:MAG: DUF488 domain-containing protein [Candidatus Methanophagaceae archaeon]|nr:MAG: DUF488 domain-containing protein [Methanophagales archaeon]
MKIWTVGTSKRSLEGFLDLLGAYRIEAVADVRRFPRSKFKHFNQENLEASLNRRGVKYLHLAELGGHRKGGYKKFTETEEFEKGLTCLEELAGTSTRRVAVVCAELRFSQCHRRFIADALKLRGYTVIHIIDEEQSCEHKYRSRGRAEKHKSKTLEEFLQ